MRVARPRIGNQQQRIQPAHLGMVEHQLAQHPGQVHTVGAQDPVTGSVRLSLTRGAVTCTAPRWSAPSALAVIIVDRQVAAVLIALSGA